MEVNNGKREKNSRRSEAAKAWAKKKLEADPEYFVKLARRNKDRSYQIGNTHGFGRSREWAEECGRKGAAKSLESKAKKGFRSARLRNSDRQGQGQTGDRLRGSSTEGSQ